MLPQLPSLQAAWLMLYFCAVPRLNHLLRTTPPTQSRAAAEAHDNNVLRTFKSIFGIQGPEGWDNTFHGVSYTAWVAQSKLPLRLGGLGLRDSARLAPAAYWASWADSLPSLIEGFPTIGRDTLHNFAMSGARESHQYGNLPHCLVAAELAGRT